jgi:CHAT domain-containing protein/tetratricopeptide (TPR) repeat protein
MMSTIFALVLLAVVGLPPLPARTLPEATRLEDGRTIERRVATGDDHRYFVAAAAGDCIHVIVEQHGVDLIAQTRDRSGNPIADFNDEVRREGEEHVALVADASGIYSVMIRAASVANAAGRYTIRIAVRHAATDADRSMQQSRRLRTAAARLDDDGRFAEGRALLERALRLSEANRGTEDADVARLLYQLSGNALEQRDDVRALQLDERAIAIFDKVKGAGDPLSAMARSRLAVLYERTGREPAAEALLRSAIAVVAQTVGSDHLWYAQCLISQGNLRFDAGDLDRAETLNNRALVILERIQNVDGGPYAAVLNNLGEIALEKHDLARAESLLRRSLAVAERLEGARSYRVSATLQNLGIVSRQQLNYVAALAYVMRALSIREQVVGPDHADIAPLLNNLANLYHLNGNDDQALALHFRALAIRERTVGSYHRGTLNSVGSIARIYTSLGDTANAVAFTRRADAIVEKQLALNMSAGSEREKLAFLRSVAERTDRTVSLHLTQAPENRDASSLAALVLLQRKGRVQDAMADVFAAVRHRVDDAGDRALMDQLGDTQARLARISLDASGRTSLDERMRLVVELESRRERLEATLSAHIAEFRADTQPVTVEAVQAALPENAALVEFAVFRPFDPWASRDLEAYGAPRYAAYILRRHAAPIGLDLGALSSIDQSIAALRAALRDPLRADVKVLARVVDEQVMEPLRAALGGAAHLVISPDGNLNLVPFEALVDENGRYLVERYAMSYVTSGRDLLRMPLARPWSTAPVIVADPLFDETPVDGIAPPGPRPGVAAERGRAAAIGAQLSDVYFAPLVATGIEARAIKELFPDAALFTGRQASKATLEHVRSPRILHIASHGFFLDADAQAHASENPMLRSGLALTGANLTASGRGDGILTALEASGLDLWGTRLVTLSACDTGIGEIRNGEGVYGLRRAFVLAGAETLVMSLWPVSDYVARDTMVAYYTGLRAGLGRGDALRQARLALLKRSTRRHPYYWAGFIQSGEWADLNGRR